MGYQIIRLGFIGVALLLCSASEALADGPVSVYVGPDFLTDQSALGLTAGAVGTDVALGYDLGRNGPSKLRYRLDLDDSFVASTDARLGYVSAGASARLSSPFYVGAGATVDRVTVRQRDFFAYPGFGGTNENGPQSAVATTTITNLGGNFFLGQKVLSSRGLGLSVEASYKLVPTVSYVNLDGVRVGLRANF